MNRDSFMVAAGIILAGISRALTMPSWAAVIMFFALGAAIVVLADFLQLKP